MKRGIWTLAAGALLLASLGSFHLARADFELKGTDGRRILLKDNGTWAYIGAGDKDGAADKSKQGDLVLFLERKMDRDKSCRFVVRLANNLTYPVGSLVLYYSAYRMNGVIYSTVSPSNGFNTLKPGDSQQRQIEVNGLPCNEISRLQVVGGDRCELGDLTRWSDQVEHKGQCLAQVRVAESGLIRFDK